MQNRRRFIQQIASGAMLAGMGTFPVEAFSASDEVHKLTILHSNDVHSHIDPFPQDDKKYPGMGGMAQKAALINAIRAQEDNVLLLDCGDIFQGTPYFNFYHGELEMKLMSEMQYDAATMGNHDFDNGIEGFEKQLVNANFPIIISNYDLSDTVMHDKTLPYKIFIKKNVKVGVFGLGIELHGLVPDNLYGNTRYLDPVVTAQRMADILKQDEKCDVVICLSHLGYSYDGSKISDVSLSSQTHGIDIILGGHTHTFLQSPVVYKNKMNENVLVNQIGWAGVWLGRIDIFFRKKFGKKWHSGAPVIVSK